MNLQVLFNGLGVVSAIAAFIGLLVGVPVSVDEPARVTWAALIGTLLAAILAVVVFALGAGVTA
ncbi:hypothetical protein [Gordonia tangerina]|uniref:Holin n=1 Tax=Gordonia tangerina TaxID=2911060 RepID=A0ABS9DQ64_9ACTN|nr:hypothetical protein [Gordonia tangerina]MCF3939948.1 hypothetical protein [Gordonia tangerina]